MYEERGGSVTCDGNFGVDPLVLRADIIESREKMFCANQPPGQNYFLVLYMVTLIAFKMRLISSLGQECT